MKVQPFADVITKATLSPQLFKGPECWSGPDLNLRPPAQQSGALTTELTGRRKIENVLAQRKIVLTQRKIACARSEL